VAFSVAKLTVALTPSSRLSFFSIRAAHDAHGHPLDIKLDRLDLDT
jgi:hypothetical protein